MLKTLFHKFLIFISFLIGLISIDGYSQQDFKGKVYLDSIMDQLELYSQTQQDEKMLLVSSHLLDTLLQFNPEQTSCYYSVAYICRGVQLIGSSDHLTGMEYFNKAIEVNEICGNIEYDIKSLNGLGTFSALYLTPNDAIPYFKRADSIRIANKLDYMEFTLNYNMALAYNDLKNGIEALKYLKVAEGIVIQEMDSFRLSAIYHGYALNYDLIKDFENSEIYHEKALSFQPYKDGAQAKYYMTEFINFLRKRNKFKKASDYQEKLRVKLVELSDNYKSKLDEELNQNHSEKERLLNAEKVNLENQLELEKAQNQDRMITASLVIILLISLLLIYTFFNLRKQKKVGRLLNSQNEKLAESKQATQELLTLKTQFSETVSHELRTPLHGIIGLTDILIDDEKQNLTQKGQNHLQSLKFSADYLLSLINDVLEFSKLDAKKLKLENSVFDIHSLAATLSSSFQHFTSEKELEFKIIIDENIPHLLIGDSVRLSQILINLVGNSFKFTNQGQINLKFIKLFDDETKVKIKFEVEDTGVGIPISKQKMIFDKFIQIDDNNSGKGGTGLGLSIVKQLIDLFGSKIHLRSEVEKGTLFWFEIEFLKPKEKTFQNSINQVTDRIIEGGRVLIVDDNHINLIVTENILEKNNYEVVTCDNGYSAIQFIESEEFDLVLMDLHMPKVDGVEATNCIKAINNEIPVILLTASNVGEEWEYYKNLGFADFIIKPYDKVDFLNKVQKNMI